jgi:hypothetical protein
MARRTPTPSSSNGAESPPGSNSQVNEKETINLRLPTDALTRLKVHCALERRTASDVVTDLINRNLPTYEEVTKEHDARKSP